MVHESLMAGLQELGGQVGGFAPYWAILALVAVDVLVGLALAVVTKTLSAKAIARTPAKVLGVTLTLALALAMSLATPALGALVAMVMAHAAASEALSILRNAMALYRHLGIEPPALLAKVDAFLLTAPGFDDDKKQA